MNGADFVMAASDFVEPKGVSSAGEVEIDVWVDVGVKAVVSGLTDECQGSGGQYGRSGEKRGMGERGARTSVSSRRRTPPGRSTRATSAKKSPRAFSKKDARPAPPLRQWTLSARKEWATRQA